MNEVGKTFTTYLADDLSRFSVSFPVIMIIILIFVVIISLVFRDKKDLDYDEIVSNNSKKHLKQVMKV